MAAGCRLNRPKRCWSDDCGFTSAWLAKWHHETPRNQDTLIMAKAAARWANDPWDAIFLVSGVRCGPYRSLTHCDHICPCIPVEFLHAAVEHWLIMLIMKSNGGRDWEPEWSGVGLKPSVLPRSSPRRELGSFFLRQGNGTVQKGIPEGWSNWSAQVHVYHVCICLYHLWHLFVWCILRMELNEKETAKKKLQMLLFRSCSPLFERCTVVRAATTLIHPMQHDVANSRNNTVCFQCFRLF